MRRRTVIGGLMGFAVASPSWSQPSARSPVVVLDRDALFARSLFGRRLRGEVERASAALARENRGIQAELEAEERSLTERRSEMEPEAFRPLADGFDDRVEAIRSEQDAKARQLQTMTEEAQADFQDRAGPVLGALAREIGALVILDRRLVIAATDQADITEIAIKRIDAALGEDGQGGRPADDATPVPVDD